MAASILISAWAGRGTSSSWASSHGEETAASAPLGWNTFVRSKGREVPLHLDDGRIFRERRAHGGPKRKVRGRADSHDCADCDSSRSRACQFVASRPDQDLRRCYARLPADSPRETCLSRPVRTSDALLPKVDAGGSLA